MLPPHYLDRQIYYYYGELPGPEQGRMKNRLYYFLMEMQKRGDRPDLEEAVRQERFRYGP